MLSYEKNACTICGSKRREDFIEIRGGAVFCPPCAKDANVSRPKPAPGPFKNEKEAIDELNKFFGGVFK